MVKKILEAFGTLLAPDNGKVDDKKDESFKADLNAIAPDKANIVYQNSQGALKEVRMQNKEIIEKGTSLLRHIVITMAIMLFALMREGEFIFNNSSKSYDRVKGLLTSFAFQAEITCIILLVLTIFTSIIFIIPNVKSVERAGSEDMLKKVSNDISIIILTEALEINTHIKKYARYIKRKSFIIKTSFIIYIATIIFLAAVCIAKMWYVKL